MLEGGRPYKAVSIDCACKKSDQRCEHNGYEKASDLHGHKNSDAAELRVLHQTKSDLEKQLRGILIFASFN